MTITWRDLLLSAFATVISSSCSTAPPGAGFTNGDDKATLSAEEKPAVRDDLSMPTNPNSGDASLAGPAASGPPAAVDGQSKPPGTSSNPPATPPRIESSDAAGAQGGTRPPENIKVGTPRSPQ
jgi:hypothetical protein